MRHPKAGASQYSGSFFQPVSKMCIRDRFGASITYAASSYLANWALDRNSYYSGSLYDLSLIHI